MMTHMLMPAASSDMLTAAVPSLPSPVVLAYIAAAILFILAAAGLSRHETAVAGNVAGAIGWCVKRSSSSCTKKVSSCTME